MFTKLLKHEFKSQAGLFAVLSAAALGLGVLGGIMASIAFSFDSLFVSTSEPVGMTAAFGVIMSMLFMVFIIFAISAYAMAIMLLLYYRFYKKHFTDEGYLTFTLPATTHQILLSSVANNVIWMLISFVVTGIAILMVVLPIVRLMNQLTGGGVHAEFTYIFSELGAGYIVLYIISMICSIIGRLILPLVSITLGALAVKKYKLLAAFGIYYGINMVLSVIVGIVSIFAVLGDEAIAYTTGSSAMAFSMLIPSLLYLGIGIGGYFLMHHLVDEKLNLS